MQKLYRNLLVMCMVLVLSLSLSACGTPKVKHNDDPLWEVELEGANPEFVEDYIYMWDVLENEYPLLSTAERITGKDAKSIKESYYKRIQHGVANPEDFFSFVICPCLEEFNCTGHLFSVNDKIYETRYVLYQNFSHDSFNNYNYKQLTRPKSKKFYTKAIEKVESDIAENNDITEIDGLNTSDNLSFEYYPEQSAAYVEIKQMNIYDSLDNPEYKALAEFFTKIEKKGYKNCIIDISHNGGGNSEYWVEGIVKPNLTETLSTNNYALIKGDMCRNYLSSVTDIHPIDELPSEKLTKLNADDLSEANYYILLEEQYSSNENTKPLFTGEFWLLVGDITYSSSEMMAAFCKYTGFATLVGTNTGGDGNGIDPMVISLPNTGICFRFSAELGLNIDGSGNEEYGTIPDYKITEGEDALEKCLQLIAEGK